MKRCRFTEDFKARVAFEAMRGEKTIQEIAAKYQVHPDEGESGSARAVEGLGNVFSQGGGSAGRGP